MVLRTTFINKLRELQYSYRSQQKRTQMYRKAGGTHCIFVPLKDELEDDFVKHNLRQAGIDEKEIESFLASAKS